jgi:H+/Cl- antiporter ClcA
VTPARPPSPPPATVTNATDPLAPLRSRSYVVLLVLAAIIGVPISATAFGFLALVSHLQGWVFTSLPRAVGFHAEPLWWPLPWLVLAGILVGPTIRYLPGTAGHKPAEGFKPGGPRRPSSFPGSSSRRWPPCPWAWSWGLRRR